MGKQYNSFKEIDERLMVLKLQRKIEIESLKLNINQAKANLRPLQLAGSLKGSLQQMLLIYAIRKLKSIFNRR
ncbi:MULTISPECIES: DUF6327 family protein [Arenibacter]|uniref:Glutaminyl-tRNA synthetase n=2 Tax=Arenibacter TaxID=178469 RepID=A0A327QZ92_9FLAO|nr:MULTISPECIES: DUF6327 family protein [Arenibacter]MCK0135109.1 DUF6327 family protein [Arenibacter sp. S6351L]MDO6602343.1 DUF6327 family protein [Arenibacter palladensis]RAJ09088.1 hypothetical protein LV92_03306 [Arenibacter echinorum]SHF30326.1 hypothetical protein SAMN03080594_103271 [Arenibacter palladensis]|tara:strand:+ start:145 stop:363 length:219 start_codon:yes stop_codon:yes gene_type:complete